MSQPHSAWTGVLVAILAGSIHAADNTDTVTLDPIEVIDNLEERALTYSPMPVSVIDATQFHGRNFSLNEILQRVAGVRVFEEGGLGSRATVTFHGLQGKRVKIFIDGDPLNSPDGSFGINDIPVQLIERIA